MMKQLYFKLKQMALQDLIYKISVSLLMIFTICIITSCNNNKQIKKDNAGFKDDVIQMMDSVSQNISSNGPKAWLNYFENTPSFFMASDGKLVFPDYNTATKFINDTLVNIISSINLKWSNINIDILNDKAVAARAGFHEDIKFKQGNIAKIDGYFTAVIDNTSAGYKFRNLHWSIIK